jgi:RNA polymerase sigma factor (sigma-70 family)
VVQPFEDVVAEHGAVVLRVCRAMLGHAEADDAWAETFLAALKAYPNLRPDSNVRAWLVTIAHRKAIDQTRSRARRPLPVADLPEAPSTVGVPAAPDTELWAAFQALPLKQRGAVAYHHLAGMPYSEVAVLLDSSEAAARRSAADGIASLRRNYPKGIPDDEHERQ